VIKLEKTILEEERIKLGKCSCCGGTIIFEIYNDMILRWICSDKKTEEACENYGKAKCNSINCVLNDTKIIEKRLEYREIIKTKFMDIMNKHGRVVFEPTNEIIYSVLDLNLEDKGYMFQKLDNELNLYQIFEVIEK